MPSPAEPLGPKDADALRAFLAKDPVHNLYFLGLLEEFGVAPKPGQPHFTIWGHFVERELKSALFVGGDGGLLVPSANDSQEVVALAEGLMGKVKLKAALGEKAAIDGLVRHLHVGKPQGSWSQRLYSVSADDLGPFTNPTLRLAREDELPRVLVLAAGCVRETLKRDPLKEDGAGFRARVLQRLKAGRTYVLEIDGDLVFKIDIGSRSQYGAELEGLYTLPEQRRRGHATLSLGQISRHLLSSLPRLTLRVDDQDPSLAGVARKVGYLAGRPQKLVVSA